MTIQTQIRRRKRFGSTNCIAPKNQNSLYIHKQHVDTGFMTASEFVKFVAELKTPDENDELTDDDIAMTLGEVIATARQVLAEQ